MMHAGMIPHHAWRTQHRLEREGERDRQSAGRKEGGKGLTDQGTSRKRSGVERRVAKYGELHPASVFSASVSWVRLTGIPVFCLRQGLLLHNAISIFATMFEIIVSALSQQQLLLPCCKADASRLCTSRSGCFADTIFLGLSVTLNKMTQIWASAR